MANNIPMGLRQRFALTRRAFEIQWRINRKFFLSNLCYGIISTLSPFAAIWFSARLLSELAGNAARKSWRSGQSAPPALGS